MRQCFRTRLYSVNVVASTLKCRLVLSVYSFPTFTIPASKSSKMNSKCKNLVAKYLALTHFDSFLVGVKLCAFVWSKSSLRYKKYIFNPHSNNLQPIATLVSMCLKHILIFILRKCLNLKLKSSGGIIKKTFRFPPLSCLVLVLITHDAITSVKWSICYPSVRLRL